MLAQYAHRAKFLLNDHAPTILTGVGVAGTVVTAVLTGRASFKAAQLIDMKQETLESDLRFPEVNASLSKPDKIKLVWRQYIPPVASGAITITSIVAANRMSSAKIAALTVAGLASERALTEYKDKVIEKLGPKQDEKVRDSIAYDRVHGNPPGQQVVVIGSGDVMCYDMLTGRYFKSSMEAIKRAENKVASEILKFMSCNLSFFYDEIGLPPTDYTDTVGWNTGNVPEVQVSTVLSPDEKPCLAIHFTKTPILDYDKHWDSSI